MLRISCVMVLIAIGLATVSGCSNEAPQQPATEVPAPPSLGPADGAADAAAENKEIEDALAGLAEADRLLAVEQKMCPVSDHPLGMAVPAPRGNVHVVIVEEEPDLGQLGRFLSLVRLLLNESRNRLDSLVRVLVENAVDRNGLDDARRANGDVALGIARHDRGGRDRSVIGAGDRREETERDRKKAAAHGKHNSNCPLR